MTQAKYKGYFKIVAPRPSITTMSDNQEIGDQSAYSNFTWYQRSVQGSASRLTRYREYDIMDNDVEIARSLDTIAEEMIGSNPDSELPIELVIDSEKDASITSSMATTLKAAMKYWADLHDWQNRLFKIARNAIKYGDCFFIRHKDTSKWEYVHPKNVVAAIVDDRDMTRVLGWQMKREQKTPNSPYNQPTGQYGGNSNELVDTYPAEDVVWFSLNDDMSESAPFGDSVLRAVFKAQKQKELLEDAILIYRIQRAPERRVFYVDVGNMPPQRVKTYLEQIKNDIRQRKVPTYGGGVEQVDSIYNPQQMSEDFFFAQRADGRGSKVETLPGGQGLGELADLEYFQWKVFRGLRIPLSYMREGQEGSIISDGKSGVAYIAELRFAMYVQRLQGPIERVLDKEFKRYLRAAGIACDPTTFHIKLNEPENFGIYRQQQLNSELLNTYNSAAAVEFISKRFGAIKYLNWTDEEILRNYRMRCEELSLDPDGDMKTNMIAVYGPPPTEGGMDAGGAAGGMAMTAGGGFDPMAGAGLGADASAPPTDAAASPTGTAAQPQ